MAATFRPRNSVRFGRWYCGKAEDSHGLGSTAQLAGSPSKKSAAALTQSPRSGKQQRRRLRSWRAGLPQCHSPLLPAPKPDFTGASGTVLPLVGRES